MISYISNLNLNAANTLFNEYITFLIKEVKINNNLLINKIEKISQLNLSPTDNNYIVHALNEMIVSNDAYISLLLSFQKEYTAFEKQNLHPIAFYSPQDLAETLDIHWKKIAPKIT